MKSHVLCLGNMLEPRVHAGLRRDFPLLYVVPFLLLGQLLGTLWWIWPLPGACLVILCSRYGTVLRSSMLSIAVGILSVAARLPSAPVRLPGETETVQASIQSQPRRPHVGEVRFEVLVSSAGSADRRDTFRALCSAVDLPWRNAAALVAGDVILMRAKFKFFRPGGSPFSYSSTLLRDGIQARCKVSALKICSTPPPPIRERFLAALRENVEEVLGDGERAGLLLSMGLGVRDVLSDRTEQAFKATGLAHLLVVSGYQVTMVFGSIFLLLRRIAQFSPRFIAMRLAQSLIGWAAFGVSIAFVYLVGIEGSTLRAGLALLFCLIVRQAERRGGMCNGILASLAVISAIWPGAIFEPGVELTYAALCGIALGTRQRGSAVLTGLSVTFFATAATALVGLMWFGTLSLAGFFLNPLLAPLLGFISCEGGFLSIAAHFFDADPKGFGLVAISAVLEAGRDAVLRASEVPFASLQPQGLGFAAAISVLGSVLAARVIFKINQYVAASGLDSSAP